VRITLVTAVLALVVAAAASANAPTARVAYVIDGDTIALTNGVHVRLLQIDTPETGTGECYSRAAGRDLRRMLPTGAGVALEADPAFDRADRYGRLLRYVWYRGRNLNLRLVRDGSATVWFYGGDRGKYARPLLAASRAARTAHQGLWGACDAVWDPYEAATTRSKTATTTTRANCDASYPDVCIPSPPPDLDCADVPHKGFRVVGADPHRFDGDHDGFGCER
jgi:endonuclease YncB( thermonuclease family)